MLHPHRTHTCEELRRDHAGQEVRLSGWIHRKRDHGNLLFIDLRDHYGITQCVIDCDSPLFSAAEGVKNESVITVTGEVSLRPEDTLNEKLPTGEVELLIHTLEIESPADMLPIQVNSSAEFPEETRLTYRYLDLRREKIHRNIVLRSQIIASIRKRMTEQGFLEIQTPILTASSPEGARDFLVPSRLHPGQFYALPQAPQMFKQLLMVGGFDKYFQIAPCFRDEDARADRSPGEFYQLDMEMAFATQEDVFKAIEPVLHGVYEDFSDWEVTPAPFPCIPYKEALLKYGNDKPDLRIPFVIADVTEVFKGSGFSIFEKAIQAGSVVRAIPAPGSATQPRSFFDKMNEWARTEGAPGLGYIVFESGVGKGPIAKFFDETRLQALKETTKCGDGDAVFFACAHEPEAAALAGKARLKVAADLDMIEQKTFRFCWVVDYPMFEYDPQTKQIGFSHNPFSMPQGGMEALKSQDPLEILAYQYDIVCNGIELCSGAIRNHKPDIMYKAFEIAGYTRDQVDGEFSGMINAFKFGAPPHGGCAPGLDRMVMMLADEPNLREVVAFPMNQQAQDLMMGAPCSVKPAQLRELHIDLKLPPEPKVVTVQKENAKLQSEAP